MPVFENITEGLPSTEVHDIYQDSLGFIWFATDRGVAKYDGDRIQKIKTDKYLKVNCVFKFFEQCKTKVWIVSKNRRLYWFNPCQDNPIFSSMVFNNQLEYMKKGVLLETNISNIQFGENSFFIFFRSSPGYIEVDHKKGCISRLTQDEDRLSKIADISQLSIHRVGPKVYTQVNFNIPSTKSSDHLNLLIENLNIGSIKDFEYASDLGLSSQLSTNGLAYYSIANIVIREKKGKFSILEFPDKVLCMEIDQGGLLIGTESGAYSCDDKMQIQRKFLDRMTVTSIHKGASSNFWFSTTQSGVYFSKSFSSWEFILPFYFKTTNVKKVGGGIHLYEEDLKELVVLDENKKIVGKHGILQKRNRVIFKDNEMLKYFVEYSPYKFLNSKEDGTNQLIKSEDFNRNYFAEMGKLRENEDGVIKVIFQFKKDNNVNCSYQLDEQRLLIGTEKGLFYFDLNTMKIIGEAIENSIGIDVFAFANLDGRIIITTNQGLYLYEKNKIVKIESEIGEKIKGIFKQNDNTLWVYCDNSIYTVIARDSRLITNPYKFNFGKRNSVITSLTVFNNELWVATKRGLFVTDLINRINLTSENNFKLYIDSSYINNHKIKTESTFILNTRDKLNVFFSMVSFDRSISRDLEYSLDGINWYETNKNRITLSNMEAGDYRLKIRLVDSPLTILHELPISVKKQFFRTFWFQMLAVIFFGFVLVYFVRRIYKIREKKKEDVFDRLNIELKLLTSKMNPHFTFNTINSIQYYIMKSDKKEAITYLSDFALLIRKSLDFTMNERISIAEEIEFLELYVSMENKRFSSNFILDFQVAPIISTLDKKIPSMLIQPLIENVILHADYEESSEKLIRVKISHNHGYYNIHVIDFGQGIKSNSQIKDHKSYGLEILKSRVKIYNGKDFEDADVKMGMANLNKKIGTKVEIRIKEWT